MVKLRRRIHRTLKLQGHVSVMLAIIRDLRHNNLSILSIVAQNSEIK